MFSFYPLFFECVCMCSVCCTANCIVYFSHKLYHPQIMGMK